MLASQLLMQANQENPYDLSLVLLASNPAYYEKAKSNLQQAIKQVEERAQDPEELANLIWAYVMAIQAAARAHDEVMLSELLNDLLLCTKQSSILSALQTGLTRSDPPKKWNNDYPAWAVAMVCAAFAEILQSNISKALQSKYQAWYQELEHTLNDAMEQAKCFECSAVSHGEKSVAFGALAEQTLASLVMKAIPIYDLVAENITSPSP